MATPVTHIDDASDPLMTGSHRGADGASVLYDPDADFESCGVNATIGQLVLNTTDGSQGVVTASTEDTVTVSLSGGSEDDWDNGDTYVILKTATEDSLISTHWTDKRFGQKVTDPAQLDEDGVFPADADIDEEDEEVFGPNQPERNYRG